MSNGATPITGRGGQRPRLSAAIAATGVPAGEAAAVPVRPALAARNERLLLGGVAAYVALLTGLMIARGVAVTPDVLLVGLGLAAVLLGRGRLFLRDWIPFLALFFAYELMRGYADDAGASVHVTDVIDLERLFHLGVLPTEALQRLLHPATGADPWAIGATIVYFLHFPLPLAIAFLLWLRRRALYYDYVASLILLCLVGFATHLVLPVAPPWWAAERGFLSGPDGLPLVEYLKPEGFAALASALGFDGRYIYSYTFYQIAPNPVAAFPSLHAAFPFLAFLYARRAFGRAGWGLFGYFLLVVFSIVYLADHYLVDAYAGAAYAAAAAFAIGHGPRRVRAWLDRLRDARLEADATAPLAQPQETASAAGAAVAVRVRRGVDRPALAQGLAVLAVGLAGVALLVTRGEGAAPVALVPWSLLLAGAWRAAAALYAR